MACYSPIKGFRPLSREDGGRLVFDRAKALNPDNPTVIPCNNCIGCRIDRSREWAVRCTHEAQMWGDNSYLTLTYDDEHYPEDGSVQVRTFQLFMKRLRKSLRGKKIRFFACGEYGDQSGRAHYHSLIFNHQFTDLQIYKTNKQGDKIYTSTTLDQIWGLGQCFIGSVTYQSAAYVARYIMKKINGDLAATHYLKNHPVTGVLVKLEPEFRLGSNRPGLGETWFRKFQSDCFPSDFIVVDGKEHPVPKYYQKLLAAQSGPISDQWSLKEHGSQPEEKIKRKRRRKALPQKWNNTRERLAVRKEVKLRKLQQLKREL